MHKERYKGVFFKVAKAQNKVYTSAKERLTF